jgi:hypothetical protein
MNLKAKDNIKFQQIEKIKSTILQKYSNIFFSVSNKRVGGARRDAAGVVLVSRHFHVACNKKDNLS